MTETKKWWQSKTIWGSIVTLVAVVASLAGYQIDTETQNQLVTNITNIVAAVGSLIAVYGRVTASAKIK